MQINNKFPDLAALTQEAYNLRSQNITENNKGNYQIIVDKLTAECVNQAGQGYSYATIKIHSIVNFIKSQHFLDIVQFFDKVSYNTYSEMLTVRWQPANRGYVESQEDKDIVSFTPLNRKF